VLFGKELAEAIKSYPGAAGFIFAQQLPGRRPRLPARIPRAVGDIDTAQFVFRRSAIGDIRWPSPRASDFTFAKAVCDANPGRVITIDRPAALYNALRPLVASRYKHPLTVPGWFSEAEGRLWWTQCRGRRVLELGRFRGRSLACALQSARQVVSIDHDPRSAGLAEKNIAGLGLDLTKASLLTGKISKLVPTLTGRFGAVLFDAGHTRKDIDQDVRLVTPFLDRGAVLGFHDYDNPPYPDVKKTVDRLADAKHWEPIGVAGLLAVFRVRDDCE
jgi:hypothetical protein